MGRWHRRQGDPGTAVAYLRTSTEDQQLGPAAQRAAIERWAASRGIEVVAWHEDHVCGAMPPLERPAMAAALADLEKFEAGLLVVGKRDRLARDPTVARHAEREAEARGARIVSAAGEGDGDTPEAVFTRGVSDLLAELERGKIRQRTREALAVLRSRGQRTGQVPFGCRLAADGRTLVPEATEQDAIARVLVLRESGMSLRGIAELMNLDGVRCRGVKWHPTTIVRLVGRAVPAVPAAPAA